jgi:DNA-binding NtrC family response regulator
LKEQPIPLKILFAEDEDSLRVIMAEILTTHAGYQVDTCSNGSEAISLLKQKPYDVVVLDYKMPGVTGLNVLQWMHEQKMETPSLILTGAGTETVAVEAMKLGAYDYIRKEYVEMEHLPIIINGVHERYLFKKEKNLRKRLAENNVEEIVKFIDTVAPISAIMENAIAKLSTDVEKYDQELKPEYDDEAEQSLRDALSSIKQDLSVISFAVSSVLNLTHALCDNIAGENIPHAQPLKQPAPELKAK